MCWDTFDNEGIWELFRERRIASGAKPEPVAGSMRPESTGDPRRRVAPSGGRWQRGVALPPPEEAAKRKSDNANSPEELWDDPGGTMGAAADFSAFGAMPIEEGEFDFEKMAEATQKIDEELHGPAVDGAFGESPTQGKTIDKARPLASAGMTITSGSGDNVNVFEDFDSPGVGETVEGISQEEAIDPSASSRLMKMIGVDPPKSETAANGEAANPWEGAPEKTDAGVNALFGNMGLSLNPWGGAGAAPVDANTDTSGRLEQLAAEQRARDQQSKIEKQARQEAEMRRREQEEAQRQAIARRQAEELSRTAALQQQPSAQSQVELVLMERICAILENSWGRSDLPSILATLHSEDSRVIPLLGNADALRALIARSPQRIALRRDPSFAGDMAVLLMTNAQWQQQQEAQARHQEELRRRQLEEARQAHGRRSIQIDPDRPWFYSDPQNNVQVSHLSAAFFSLFYIIELTVFVKGPFRGEEMRQWLEAGYFKGDLPISQQPTGPFQQLSMLFPDLNRAFKVPNVDNQKVMKAEAEKQALEEQRDMQKREEEQRAREARELEKVAEAERKASEAAAAAAAAAAAEASSQKVESGTESSSTQLKMMLGLSGGLEAEEVDDTVAKRAAMDKKSQKANKKTQAKAPTVTAPLATKNAVQGKSAAAPWGGAVNSKPKKSISEIQQEEARRAAIEAAQGGGSRQQSNGWANVAAGSQGWSNGIVKKASAPAATGVNGNLLPTQVSRNPLSAPSTASTGKKPSALSQHQRASSTSSGSTPAEDFGATMSPALEAWCKDQMQSLNGSDDLTLIAFCMTLTDANEIRQYLQAYLGSGPKVNSFATDFIDKRGLGKKQEEWETPGSAKKGRKKKTGTR